jgi:hypothetical protein
MTPQSKVPVWLIGLILVGTILSCLSYEFALVVVVTRSCQLWWYVCVNSQKKLMAQELHRLKLA